MSPCQVANPVLEPGHTRHDPAASLFAADIDVAVVRIAHEPVATTFKFAIQLVQHEIRKQRRERTTLRGALPAGLKQPVGQHPGRQIASDQPKHPPILDARRHAGHEFVVIDPVEKLRQIYIDNELIAVGDIGLRLRHRLLGRASRPEAVTVLAERRVPQRLKPLEHRLLDDAIDHGWNAESTLPAAPGLGDHHPTHRLRLVAPLEQLMFDLRPARFEEVRELPNGDPVDAGRPLVAHHRTQRRFYVLRVTDCLHQIGRGCRAFGFGRRRGHFDLSHERTRGFTPTRHRQVQCELEWRSRCGHEMSKLLALSFNPSSGTVRAFGRRRGLLHPLLTSAPRSGSLAAASVRPVSRQDTVQISRGKSRSLPRTPAGFTAMALDGYGLCDFLPARPTMAASYPVAVRRVAISFHASFRRSLAVPPLRFTRASPPSGCTGDFHPRLPDMPGTQNRATCGRSGTTLAMGTDGQDMPYRMHTSWKQPRNQLLAQLSGAALHRHGPARPGHLSRHKYLNRWPGQAGPR